MSIIRPLSACIVISFVLASCSVAPVEKLSEKGTQLDDTHHTTKINAPIHNNKKPTVITEERIVNAIEYKDHVAYAVGEKEPFTGRLIIYWPESTNKKVEAMYKDGRSHGLTRAWHENGNRWYEVNWVEDKRQGLSTNWYKSGQKENTYIYKDDEYNGVSIAWYKNGQRAREGVFRSLKMEGEWRYWYENGSTKAIKNYKNGKYHGIQHEWLFGGLIHSETNWLDGELVK